jgi:hypothetical protein
MDSALYSLLRYDTRGPEAVSLLLRAAKVHGGSGRVQRVVAGLEEEDAGFVLLALMSSIFGLNPEGVLGRMEDKAVRMGDSNPWWVQLRGGRGFSERFREVLKWFRGLMGVWGQGGSKSGGAGEKGGGLRGIVGSIKKFMKG